MPTAFFRNENGEDVVLADPDSDLDYSVSTWLEGLLFIAGTSWLVSPAGPTLYNPQINITTITVDGVPYVAGKIASTWIKDLVAGKRYKVTLKGTFTGNRKDDRSFFIECRNR